MRRGIVLGLTLVLSLAAMAQGAYVEYQGTGGSLVDATKWYIITNQNNPTSTTGVTRLPRKYIGTAPTGTVGDTAIIRNATTTTVQGTLESQNLLIGGPLITGQPTAARTTVYIPSGGTLSLYSDQPTEDEGATALHLDVGGVYPATLNVNGGFVNLRPNRGGGIFVGTSGTAQGVVNFTGGTIQIIKPAVSSYGLTVGMNGGNGTFNQSGGSLLKLWTTIDPFDDGGVGGDGFTLGRGGYGEYNLSGGYAAFASSLRVGATHDPDPDVGGDEKAGTGLLNITGGMFEWGRKMTFGDGRTPGIANIGHLKIMGGTFQSHYWPSPEYDPAGNGGCSDLYIGRGVGGTAINDSIGKVTITQDAAFHTLGMIMALDGGDTDSSQMELKISRAGNFDVLHTDWFSVNGTVEVSLTGGYVPAPGTEWRIGQMTTMMDVTPESQLYVNPALVITPGYHLERRNLQLGYYRDLWLVLDALQKPGDANNDGFVDVGDLGILAFNWGQTTLLGKSWTEADFTGDDIVDVGDLGVLAFNWGWIGTPTGAGSALPEPASLALLCLGGLAMLRRRR